MRILRSVVAEVIGLFIDDWLFTLFLAAWVATTAEGRTYVAATWRGPAFFTGIALLLAMFVFRRAKTLAGKSDLD